MVPRNSLFNPYSTAEIKARDKKTTINFITAVMLSTVYEQREGQEIWVGRVVLAAPVQYTRTYTPPCVVPGSY